MKALEIKRSPGFRFNLVDAVFLKYDVDKSGFLESKEMKEMVKNFFTVKK